MLDSVIQQWSQSIWKLPKLLLSQGNTFTAYFYSEQGASICLAQSLLNE
jgi:hypothetical protein